MDFTVDVDGVAWDELDLRFAFGFELRVGDVGEVVSDMLFVEGEGEQYLGWVVEMQ